MIQPLPSDTAHAGLLPLAPLVQALAPGQGYTLTALEGVRLLRSDRPLARTPVLYDPGIVIVCQGRKRGYFGQRTYVYDAHQYLAVSMPVPFTMETDASAQAPLLALYLHLDFPLAAELMLQIERHGGPPRTSAPQSMMSSPIDPPLHHAVQRLLLALAAPMDAAVLGPQLLRELYYRVLTGPQGHTLRAALAMQGHFGRIGKALQLLHAAYTQPLTVARLAQEAGMSAPSFHTHFKAVTCASPMQYLKSIRLHQARLLMVREGMTAAAACHAVGYESPSQFNREFKRLFGLTPAREVQRMRSHFAVPPKQAAGGYVSSH
ncbi:AraC family transcriptional regulator [Pseudoxanthomonas composti]|uniref:AraC family transcriptional regulator n=1 Tax=Pseudoxanthomonas composti TaxID=2137479 RepID=A0A4V1N140_9GAMM|nr:AraC family transcriptional regulator [Pseudoxanthomonas composti]RXR05934.1 AraC family transcriptional regulator [Pseudoxanthomonas composti]